VLFAALFWPEEQNEEQQQPAGTACSRSSSHSKSRSAICQAVSAGRFAR
jgi:hypothetical protein